MYNSNQNQEIVRLILRLRTLEQDYPDRMFIARRDSFVMLVSQYVDAFMRFRRQMVNEYSKK